MNQPKIEGKIRMGMIGGGPGSFIGPVHRLVSYIDNLITIVCGTFSSNYENSIKTGKEIGLPIERIYKDAEEMLEKESKLDKDIRMNLVSICTPNNLHFIQTKLALKHGYHVILDKPLCYDLIEAYELEKIVSESKGLFCLTHTYTGYPMIKEARYLVKNNKIGKIRKILVDYPQGWLSAKLEDTNHKQAKWRSDPKLSGKSCCLGDIGTHAFNLAEYVSNLQISEVCADLTTFVENRVLEDDASVLLRFENGAKGILQSSQILSGEENSLSIKIWGELGGLEWNQKDCNSLIVKWIDKPTEFYRAGVNNNYLSINAREHCRVPSGHPEVYLEAFANIYRNFAYAITESKKDKEVYDYPGINEGVRGMLFIEKCIESNNSQVKWTKLK